LNLSSEKLVSSLCFQMQLAPLQLGAAHAALVWDSTRPFAVTPEESVVAAEAMAAAAAAAAAASPTPPSVSLSSVVSSSAAVPAAVAGGVVGVWRRHGRGRGVGRWPSPQPAVPSLEL
jgi:hypothetical protein